MAWELDAILQFNMPEDQAKAFKVALLWESLVEREFPGSRFVRLRQTGDPRKSLLFRMCYKLIQETKGIIEDKNYRLYILSQLQVCKNLGKDALIEPNILIGEKAWKRWKFWKYQYDMHIKNTKQSVEEVKITAAQPKIITALESTKKFLISKFGKEPTYEDIESSIKNNSMVRWVAMQRVSPYYILLSPWVAKMFQDRSWDDVFLFDLSVYKDSINEEVIKKFKEVFKYET